uniref:Uncharacterized protein n=1 Tax=Babesia bovis TaxID=5865 RepID=A7API8_BABBO|eukprot:XP_001612040.1 hypothetical protein [Babesia bovis T2Bo]
MLDFIGTWSSKGDPQLTTALSMGLLYLNRLQQTSSGLGRRIIFIDTSETNAYQSQYIALMNVAFTALKSGITINTCALKRSTRILEQLCDVTNAKYINLSKVLEKEDSNLNHEQCILQLLMNSCQHNCRSISAIEQYVTAITEQWTLHSYAHAALPVSSMQNLPDTPQCIAPKKTIKEGIEYSAWCASRSIPARIDITQLTAVKAISQE